MLNLDVVAQQVATNLEDKGTIILSVSDEGSIAIGHYGLDAQETIKILSRAMLYSLPEPEKHYDA